MKLYGIFCCDWEIKYANDANNKSPLIQRKFKRYSCKSYNIIKTLLKVQRNIKWVYSFIYRPVFPYYWFRGYGH